MILRNEIVIKWRPDHNSFWNDSHKTSQAKVTSLKHWYLWNSVGTVELCWSWLNHTRISIKLQTDYSLMTGYIFSSPQASLQFKEWHFQGAGIWRWVRRSSVGWLVGSSLPTTLYEILEVKQLIFNGFYTIARTCTKRSTILTPVQPPKISLTIRYMSVSDGRRWAKLEKHVCRDIIRDFCLLMWSVSYNLMRTVTGRREKETETVFHQVSNHCVCAQMNVKDGPNFYLNLRDDKWHSNNW